MKVHFGAWDGFGKEKFTCGCRFIHIGFVTLFFKGKFHKDFEKSIEALLKKSEEDDGPLVAGGQGRSETDVNIDAMLFLVSIAGILAVLVITVAASAH